MKRSTLLLLLTVLVVAAAGAGAYLYLVVGDGSATNDELPGVTISPPAPTQDDDEPIAGDEALLAARDALMAAPHEVTVDLVVRVPEGADSDNPPRQEISATGIVDYDAERGELEYDFQGLANAGGFLGHLDTMGAGYVDGTAYLDVFASGRRWLSVQPFDYFEAQIYRLREVLLTSPMSLAGVLEAAAAAPAGDTDGTVTVEPVTILERDERLTSGIGRVLGWLQVEEVDVTVTAGDGAPSAMVVSFAYPWGEGDIEVEATYELAPAADPVDFKAPLSVRDFRDIF